MTNISQTYKVCDMRDYYNDEGQNMKAPVEWYTGLDWWHCNMKMLFGNGDVEQPTCRRSELRPYATCCRAAGIIGNRHIAHASRLYSVRETSGMTLQVTRK